jgi:hypothetical protein
MHKWSLWEQSFWDLLDIYPKTKQPKTKNMVQWLVEYLLLVLSGHQKVVDFHHFKAEQK